VRRKQALARTLPLRDYFLVPANYASCRSQLVQRFGELMRKLWNPRNFKGQVSRAPRCHEAPHGLLMTPMSDLYDAAGSEIQPEHTTALHQRLPV